MKYIATFEGWKLPNGMKAIKGPFRIEVYELHTGRRIGWRARIMPTHQELISCASTTAANTQGLVQAQFERRLEDWTEA